MKERLRVLFDADLSLASYHVPLDAHAEAGNNALICAELGLRHRGVRNPPIGCELVSERFGVEHRFVDVRNPI